MTILILNFDGAVEPRNPGGLGSWGWLLKHDNGAEVTSESGTIPAAPSTTNNVAEWTALGKGLRWFKEHPPMLPVKLLIRGDSKLVINQLTGQWACRAEHLQKYLARCRELLTGLDWRAEWVPRAENAEADALTVAAWESAAGKPFPHRHRVK